MGDLAAEAAADLGRDDADLVLGDARVERQQEARRCAGSGDVTQSVTSLVAELYWASAARGSIALGMSRWLTMRSLTTTSAALNAASTSPPLDLPVEADVVRDVGVELRRALLRRLLGVDDGRQRLVVHLDRVGRVARDGSGPSATTIATALPT